MSREAVMISGTIKTTLVYTKTLLKPTQDMHISTTTTCQHNTKERNTQLYLKNAPLHRLYVYRMLFLHMVKVWKMQASSSSQYRRERTVTQNICLLIQQQTKILVGL